MEFEEKMEPSEPSIRQELTDLIRILNKEEEYVRAIAIITGAGLPIASIIHDVKLDDVRLAAMMASAVSLAERINMELYHGSVKLIFIRGEVGDFLVVECGDGALVVVFNEGAYLAKLFLQDLQKIEGVCEKIAPFLKGRD